MNSNGTQDKAKMNGNSTQDEAAAVVRTIYIGAIEKDGCLVPGVARVRLFGKLVKSHRLCYTVICGRVLGPRERIVSKCGTSRCVRGAHFVCASGQSAPIDSYASLCLGVPTGSALRGTLLRLDFLLRRSVLIGGCRVSACVKVTYNGKQIPVQRAAVSVINGVKLSVRQRYSVRCTTRWCILPEHMVLHTTTAAVY
jgi:hypothetical protein